MHIYIIIRKRIENKTMGITFFCFFSVEKKVEMVRGRLATAIKNILQKLLFSYITLPKGGSQQKRVHVIISFLVMVG